MSKHSKTLIPLETWGYCSPELYLRDQIIDIGLLMEGLIYYDQIYVNTQSEPQFAELIGWFIKEDAFDELIRMFEDETLKVYDYSFISAPVEKDGIFTLLNLQDPIQATPNSFEQRFLYHSSIEKYIPHARHRKNLYKALRDRVIEIKASGFGLAVDNAQADFVNPKRSALIVQSLIDEIAKVVDLGEVPEIRTEISYFNEEITVTHNYDLNSLNQRLNGKLNIHPSTPLAGALACNKYIWSASRLECDLYLGNPISSLVGDKLYEVGWKADKSKKIIEQLNTEVEFPSIRNLVNSGVVGWNEIRQIRAKSKKFRRWLQNEGERDRNAIYAYHTEVSDELGLVKYGRKALQLTSVLGSAALGSYLGDITSVGSVEGSMVGAGVGYLLDIGSRFQSDWKPVVFGNWLSNRIKKVLEE